MKERKNRKIIEKMKDVSGGSFGQTVYFRPFAEDEPVIRRIVEETGAKKSAVVQKLLHLAVKGKQFDFEVDKKQLSRLDWLVFREKQRSIRDDVQAASIERLEEHHRELESRLAEIAENSRFLNILASEIYCVAVVSMSYLNQIFTRVVEYFSPVEIERRNAVDFANRNALGLIEHALRELENLEAHHHCDGESIQSEKLYLFTKVEKIKQRLLPPATEVDNKQK